MAEVQHRRRIRHRLAVQLDPGKAAQRLAVVQRIFQRFVGQGVPLLQEVEAPHECQPDRRLAALALHIKRP
jgi:hypothetical protein